MKKLIIYILFSFIALAVYAQEYNYVPFPDSNAVWSEVFWKPFYDSSPRWEYNQYALFNEDTVINGIMYHKLFHTNKSTITKENSVCVGGIREDSMKRVFVNSAMFQVVPEIKEVLIYDFSLNVGDKFQNAFMDSVCTNCFLNLYEIVSDISYIEIKGELRKVITFDNPNKIKWVEGIGSLQGLLQCSPDWPTDGSSNELICFHQNDSLLYFNSGYNNIYDDCIPSFILNDVEMQAVTNVNVYPNPATDEFVVFKGLDFEKLALYDNIGNLVLLHDISGMEIYSLGISDLCPGVYLYRFIKGCNASASGKLIVE